MSSDPDNDDGGHLEDAHDDGDVDVTWSEGDDDEEDSGHTHFVKVLVGRTETAQGSTEIGEASGTDVESLRASVRELMETDEALSVIRAVCDAGKNIETETLLDGVELFCLAEGRRGDPQKRTVWPFTNCLMIRRWKHGTPCLYARVKRPRASAASAAQTKRKRAAPSPEASGDTQTSSAKKTRAGPAPDCEFADAGLLVVHAPLFLDPSSSGTGQDLGVPGHANQKDLIIDYCEMSTNKTRESGG
jgi:hypothetical protein